MKIDIKTTNCELDSSTEQIIRERIDSLERFMERIKEPKEARIEIEKLSAYQIIFRAEINLSLPGKLLRAEARNKNVFLAFSEAKNDLQRQLKKYKSKLINERKRG